MRRKRGSSKLNILSAAPGPYLSVSRGGSCSTPREGVRALGSLARIALALRRENGSAGAALVNHSQLRSTVSPLSAAGASRRRRPRGRHAANALNNPELLWLRLRLRAVVRIAV